MKKKKPLQPKLPTKDEDRKIYIDNRNAMLEQFEYALHEVQQDSSSIEGEIMGMNFQQFSAWGIFNSIVEQEEYIKYAKQFSLSYVIVSEEEEILAKMIFQAKEVFGESYQEWYDNISEKIN